jgi:hypothetical protein
MESINITPSELSVEVSQKLYKLVSLSREFVDINDAIISASVLLKIDSNSLTSLDLTGIDIDAEFLGSYLKQLPNLYKLILSNIKCF